MSRHAGPGDVAETSSPEPSYSEHARTLVHAGRTGALATLSRRRPGHPFASVMPYAPDDDGRPVLLISTMAMHTQNLHTDPRASLLVVEPDRGGDPLAVGRVTLMGEVVRLRDAALEPARATYLARHPDAAYWADFEDFGFYRLEVADVYVVGGFGRMSWVEKAAYRAAAPDPLLDAASGIVEHVNRDHADALLVLARALADTAADEASMVAVDRLGFRLRLRSGERRHAARVPFPREVRTPEEVRAVLVEMLRRARAGPPSG